MKKASDSMSDASFFLRSVLFVLGPGVAEGLARRVVGNGLLAVGGNGHTSTSTSAFDGRNTHISIAFNSSPQGGFQNVTPLFPPLTAAVRIMASSSRTRPHGKERHMKPSEITEEEVSGCHPSNMPA